MSKQTRDININVEILDGTRCGSVIWIENKEKYLDSRYLYDYMIRLVVFYALCCSVLCLILVFIVFLYSFFQDGLKTADKLKQYIEKLATDLSNVSITLLSQTFDLNPSSYIVTCSSVIKMRFIPRQTQ